VVHVIPGKGLSLPNGLHIQYPDLIQLHTPDNKKEWVYQSKGMSVKVYGGKVVENFCQAVARCIIAEQMLRIAKRYKVVLTVHDAIAIVAKVEEADEARKFVEDNMRWRPLWAQDLPLACESGMGASYGDC
jgi:DNA polymerase